MMISPFVDMQTQRLVTVKVINMEALRNAMGRQVADYVVRRGLKQIAREACYRGGQLMESEGLQVMAVFSDDAKAQQMAFDVDLVANDLHPPKGMRIGTAVFVENLSSATKRPAATFLGQLFQALPRLVGF